MNIFQKSKFNSTKLPIEELRKRGKLLVIDDQDFGYIDLFKRDGYSIDKWNDVEDLVKLEQGYYDIILLDIQGIGRQISQSEQGFGVLKHLRGNNPAQIIIAYSNETWSFKYAGFYDMADAKLAKSDDYVHFKETVDSLLKARFSLGFYIQRIESVASPFNIDIQKLRTISERAIRTNNSTKLQSFLNSTLENKDAIILILQIVTSAAQILSAVVNVPSTLHGP